MDYIVTAVDETWGDRDVLTSPKRFDNYADMKGIICHTVSVMVRDLLTYTDQVRVSTITDVPKARFGVVVEWCPDGRLADPNDEYDMSPGVGLQKAVVIQGKRDDL